MKKPFKEPEDSEKTPDRTANKMLYRNAQGELVELRKNDFLNDVLFFQAMYALKRQVAEECGSHKSIAGAAASKGKLGK